MNLKKIKDSGARTLEDLVAVIRNSKFSFLLEGSEIVRDYGDEFIDIPFYRRHSWRTGEDPDEVIATVSEFPSWDVLFEEFNKFLSHYNALFDDYGEDGGAVIFKD